MNFDGNIVYNFQSMKWSPQSKTKRGICACYREFLTWTEAFNENSNLVKILTACLIVAMVFILYSHVKQDHFCFHFLSIQLFDPFKDTFASE